MKYTNKWLLALLPAALLSSCAEDVFEPYNVEMPASIADVQYLNSYQVLKDYAGNFNIGAVVDAGKYASQGAVYGLATSNFFEISGGTSTMHSAMIRDNGSYNTLNFLDMVNAAKEANQKVFGSALLSNINQNAKYLNYILQDKVDPNYTPSLTEITAHDDTRCIQVPATAKKADPWDNQFWLVFEDSPANGGESWEYKMDVRADKETSIGTQIHQGAGDYIFWAGIENIPFTTEWTTITKKGTFSTSDQWGDNKDKKIKSIALNLNDFAEANNYYFKNISFKIDGKEVIVNGDLKDSEAKSFTTKIDQGALTPSKIVDGFDYTYMGDANLEQHFSYDKPVLVVHATEKAKDPWDNQFWILFEDNPASGGESWECSMYVRATKDASIGTQIHQGAGDYIFWAGIGNVDFTTDWQQVTKKGTFSTSDQWGDNKNKKIKSIAFNLNDFAGENDYYFGSISFKINGVEVVKNVDLTGSDNSNFVNKVYPAADASPTKISPSASWVVKKDPGIPLTDQEKTDTITYALKSYISGMMTASQEYVKSWDVLQDVIANDGNGIRVDEDNNSFFNWSEYLGADKFARIAVKYAREFGGSDIKLFVNESGLDNPAKLNGLKNFMGLWEADGVTKFDGISTTISASYSENATELEATKAKIEVMLKGLAETGRIIRIAGIDLTYKDDAGVAVATSAMTVEQGKKMGELYQFIIKKYKELIPEGQRYGIFVSNITDNGDTPNGLWNAKYSRKPQYGAFADGLK